MSTSTGGQLSTSCGRLCGKNSAYLEMAVAYAITVGVLDRQTIPAELLDHLARALAFYESEQATS